MVAAKLDLEAGAASCLAPTGMGAGGTPNMVFIAAGAAIPDLPEFPEQTLPFAS